MSPLLDSMYPDWRATTLPYSARCREALTGPGTSDNRTSGNLIYYYYVGNDIERIPLTDNVTVDNGGLADYDVATDDVGGKQYQRFKLDLGGDGASSPAVGTVPVSGSVSLAAAIDVATLPALVLSAGTANIGDVDVLTLPALPAGTNNIGDVDVISLPSIPAGNNNIGDVDIASIAAGDNNIGNVDIVTLPALVAGTANIGDVDVLTVPAPLSTTGGGTEAAALRVTVANNSTGLLPVSLASVPSHAVTNAGTFAVQESGAALTALQLIDDTVYTDDTSTHATGTSKGNLIMAAAAPTDAAVNANDIGAVAMTTDRKLHVSVQDALPAGTNNIGDVDVLTVPTDPFGANADAASATGSISAKLRFIAATGIPVTSLPNVTLAAGTNTNEVVGDIAHDTGVGGNPVLIAGAAQDMDDTAPPNRVNAESDTTRLATDRDGTIFAHPHGPQVWSYHEDSSSALTDTTVHAAPGAGLSLYVTDIVCSTGAATAMNLFIEEGTTTKVLGPYYLEAVAGRGFAIHFITPKKITANTLISVTTSAAIAHSIDITGFTAQG